VGEGSLRGKSITASSVASVSTSIPQSQGGEVLLADGGSTSSAHHLGGALTERRSFDETGSIRSQQSANSKASARSGISNADRLIDALQAPMPLGEGSSRAGWHRTTSSRSAPQGLLVDGPLPRSSGKTDDRGERTSSPPRLPHRLQHKQSLRLSNRKVPAWRTSTTLGRLSSRLRFRTLRSTAT
jgi:hypothetical protein